MWTWPEACSSTSLRHPPHTNSGLDAPHGDSAFISIRLQPQATPRWLRSFSRKPGSRSRGMSSQYKAVCVCVCTYLCEKGKERLVCEWTWDTGIDACSVWSVKSSSCDPSVCAGAGDVISLPDWGALMRAGLGWLDPVLMQWEHLPHSPLLSSPPWPNLVHFRKMPDDYAKAINHANKVVQNNAGLN